MMFDPFLLIITIFFMVIGFLVSARLKSVFSRTSEIPLSSGLSGAEVARKMLRENGINDVRVESVPGQLTDHYNPITKTVNLSPDVYAGRHVAAAAVAAHECGHAVQHAKEYPWLQLRSQMVPAVNFSVQAMNWVYIAMIFLAFAANMFDTMLLIIIALQAVITLFSVVTLPVEIDASQRALVWLNSTGMTRGREHEEATTALKWAGLTYVVQALASLTTLFYYILRYLGRSDD